MKTAIYAAAIGIIIQLAVIAHYLHATPAVTSRCDGANRIYTAGSQLAVAPNDPRCTDSAG